MQLSPDQLRKIMIAIEDAINALDAGGELLLAGPDSTDHLRLIYRGLDELRAFREAYPDDQFQRVICDHYGMRGEQ